MNYQVCILCLKYTRGRAYCQTVLYTVQDCSAKCLNWRFVVYFTLFFKLWTKNISSISKRYLKFDPFKSFSALWC